MSKKGENMNFTMFYPDQTICNNINDFVKCYNQLYFYDTNTSVAAEKLSDNLINQTKFEKEDVFNILAWKIDGIAVNSTISPNEIRYKRKWRVENGKFYGDNIYHELKMNSVISYVSKNSERWLAHWDNKEIGYDPKCAQNVVSEIVSLTNKQSDTYLGKVYIVALLYFVSKGRWPIFDRFASIAMNAMINPKMKPYDNVVDTKLPQKNSIAFSQKITTVGKYADYLHFIKVIQSESDYQYCISRDIGRALWAYGKIVNKWSKIKENSQKQKY